MSYTTCPTKWLQVKERFYTQSNFPVHTDFPDFPTVTLYNPDEPVLEDETNQDDTISTSYFVIDEKEEFYTEEEEDEEDETIEEMEVDDFLLITSASYPHHDELVKNFESRGAFCSYCCGSISYPYVYLANNYCSEECVIKHTSQ